ncbi:GNAT family N-acetyltransferase [Legionella maioricensis]|uniref:Acetyltransferase n=1 Tax=Legionella maioricensis TaxID=2896528 RepID=A0A9X2D0H9_9GAMM|nr:GNAT family N-acetyltransferase [Legionella maioricensis]MCL9683607.1 acetyltransferase [Legionella maioricensis]MCL9687629.1 acetyltransferase [Legionella maioricensis]
MRGLFQSIIPVNIQILNKDTKLDSDLSHKRFKLYRAQHIDKQENTATIIKTNGTHENLSERQGIMKNKITFRPLDFSDIPLMHQWFNEPHVQQFYSFRTWAEDEVLNKLTPYITHTKPVSGFIIVLNESPLGYLQFYKVKDYPWPNQNLPQTIIDNAVGMDVFIGNRQMLGKGLGSRIIKTFIQSKIQPEFQYCIVDPDIKNEAALRCYEKLKFKEHAIIETFDALEQPTKLKLMILHCPK